MKKKSENKKGNTGSLWLKITISCVIAAAIIVVILYNTYAHTESENNGAGILENDTVQVPEPNGDNYENTAEIEQDEIKTYETITFGEWRDEPIEWRVLDIQEQKVLVISNDILALRQYHDAFSLPPWVDSSLRSWLNNDFYQTAFSEEERLAINLTLVETPDFDTEFETLYTDGSVEKTPVTIKGSIDTEDWIFCLSVEEATKYFNSSAERIAYLTFTQQDYDYAIRAVEAAGGSTEEWLYYSTFELNKKASELWWLRSGTYVGYDGDIWIGSKTMDGDNPWGWPCGVRPAMWVQLGEDEINDLQTQTGE